MPTWYCFLGWNYSNVRPKLELPWNAGKCSLIWGTIIEYLSLKDLQIIIFQRKNRFLSYTRGTCIGIPTSRTGYLWHIFSTEYVFLYIAMLVCMILFRLFQEFLSRFFHWNFTVGYKAFLFVYISKSFSIINVPLSMYFCIHVCMCVCRLLYMYVCPHSHLFQNFLLLSSLYLGIIH